MTERHETGHRPSPDGDRAALRASDVDRARTAARLQDAAGEGRLRTEELEHRLQAAFSARTYGELALLVDDLPACLEPAARRSPAGRVPVRVAASLRAAVALLVVLVLIAAAGGFGFGRSSAAAPDQHQAPAARP